MRDAFTLIELLMVIAIISLLVSVLVPSLKRARDIAKQAVCASGMRGLGQVLAIYTSDNGDRLPPAEFTGFPSPDGDDRTTWRELLLPLVGNNRTAFCCPANPSRKNNTAGNDVPRSYAANGGSVTNWSVYPAPMQDRGLGPYKMSQLEAPADLLAIVETMGEGSVPLTNHPYPANLDWAYDIGRIQRCFFIHPTGKATYAFVDGHAAAYRPIDTGTPFNFWTVNRHREPAPQIWLDKLTQAEWIYYPSN